MMWLPVCRQSHIQSTSDRIQFNDLQSLLCATLQVREHTLFCVRALIVTQELWPERKFPVFPCRTSCVKCSIRTPCRSPTWWWRLCWGCFRAPPAPEEFRRTHWWPCPRWWKVHTHTHTLWEEWRLVCREEAELFSCSVCFSARQRLPEIHGCL